MFRPWDGWVRSLAPFCVAAVSVFGTISDHTAAHRMTGGLFAGAVLSAAVSVFGVFSDHTAAHMGASQRLAVLFDTAVSGFGGFRPHRGVNEHV